MNSTALKAIQSWQFCTQLLGKPELPSQDDIVQAIGLFRDSLDAGQRASAQNLDDSTRAKVTSLVRLLGQFKNGLGDIDRYQVALAYCIRGWIAGVEGRRSLKALANFDQEALDKFGAMQMKAAVKTIEQDGIPAYERALRLKPDYTGAQLGLAGDRKYLQDIIESMTDLLR